MKNSFSQIQSSYKLSHYLVKRMTSREIKLSSGKIKPGCSKLMIATMIYFSHISSSSGNIPLFKVSELELVLRCSKRAAYQVLSDLEERELIEVTTIDGWNGIKSVKLLNNDYSQIKDYSQNRYLNTNMPFFHYRENKGYDQFMVLSLYAMRLLIYLLYNYNQRNGYHSSFDQLCSSLGIKHRRYIHLYIQEINSLFAPHQTLIGERKDKYSRKKYGSISMSAYSPRFSPSGHYDLNQESYYLHKWKRKLYMMGLQAVKTSTLSIHQFSHRIVKIVNVFLTKQNLSLVLIEATVENILKENYSIDEQTLTDIYIKLNSLAA